MVRIADLFITLGLFFLPKLVSLEYHIFVLFTLFQTHYSGTAVNPATLSTQTK